MLFDSLPEFTEIKLLPNSVDISKLWVLGFRERNCTSELLNPKDNRISQGDCKFTLYEFDLNIDKLTEKKELRFWIDTSVRDVYLLTHDSTKNVVWIGVDYQIPQTQVVQWGKQFPNLVEPKGLNFGTDLISYDANTNNSEIVQTPYWISSRFNPLHKSLVKTGKDGELYFLGECDIQCGDRKYLNEGVGFVQKNTIPPLPMFYYGQDLGSVRYFQITTDILNNYVYVITKSFDQNKPSNIFRYDANTGKSMHIGKQPTQDDDDDLRGLM